MKQALLSLVVLAALSQARDAEAKVFKYDQFSENLTTAAGQIAGQPLATQPGFAQGEGFGQIYRPEAGDYPVKVTGIDIILAAPPNAPSYTAPAVIEFWIDDLADSATPKNASPSFSISTYDLFNPSTGQLGMPLVGNTAMQIQFDWSDPDGHPPMVNAGEVIRVLIRYSQASEDLQAQWGTIQCMQMPSMGMCGCQRVGVLLDQTTTKKANLINLIWPVGQCSGTKAWKYFEDVGVTGDLIMRLQVEGGGCVPDCTGKQCGPDGCGATCGACAAGKECNGSFQCVAVAPEAVPDAASEPEPEVVPDPLPEEAPDAIADTSEEVADVPLDVATTDTAAEATGAVTVLAVSPNWGYFDEDTPVTVTGTGFQSGATAVLGATSLKNVVVKGAGLISATVPKGMAPGSYMLVVANPDGSSGFLEDAFLVSQPSPEYSSPEPAPDTSEPTTTTTASGGGCAAAGPTGASAMLRILGLAMLALARRRWS
jgi:hypothetical protein